MDPNPVMRGAVKGSIPLHVEAKFKFLHSKLSSLHAWMGKSGCRQMTEFESFQSTDADDLVSA